MITRHVRYSLLSKVAYEYYFRLPISDRDNYAQTTYNRFAACTAKFEPCNLYTKNWNPLTPLYFSALSSSIKYPCKLLAMVDTRLLFALSLCRAIWMIENGYMTVVEGLPAKPRGSQGSEDVWATRHTNSQVNWLHHPTLPTMGWDDLVAILNMKEMKSASFRFSSTIYNIH